MKLKIVDQIVSPLTKEGTCQKKEVMHRNEEKDLNQRVRQEKQYLTKAQNARIPLSLLHHTCEQQFRE